jgi:medium-chain acyl-[acyl-carrier-protein] hydrolase
MHPVVLIGSFNDNDAISNPFMTEGRTSAKPRWMSFPDDARATILCFPYAGGGASFYRPWNVFAPRTIAICPVQPPGREERFAEPCFDRMTNFVAAAADVLLPAVRPPYALFGHSMGGLVSYELTHELIRRGAPMPAHLFVSATPAPHLASTIPAIYDRPREEFLQAVQRYRGLPDAVLRSPELLELILPRLRADIAVTDTYAYAERPPLTIPITAFSGSDDDIVTPATIDAWREHTVTTFRHERFPGGHFFIAELAPTVVSILAKALR